MDFNQWIVDMASVGDLSILSSPGWPIGAETHWGGDKWLVQLHQLPAKLPILHRRCSSSTEGAAWPSIASCLAAAHRLTPPCSTGSPAAAVLVALAVLVAMVARWDMVRGTVAPTTGRHWSSPVSSPNAHRVGVSAHSSLVWAQSRGDHSVGVLWHMPPSHSSASCDCSVGLGVGRRVRSLVGS